MYGDEEEDQVPSYRERHTSRTPTSDISASPEHKMDFGAAELTTPYKGRTFKSKKKHKRLLQRDMIDYVLVYDKKEADDSETETIHERNRRIFEKMLRKEGFKVQTKEIGDKCFVLMHCSFKRLCVEAEKVNLQMPLKDCSVVESDDGNILTSCIEKYFETDNEEDFVSTRFRNDQKHLFKNSDDHVKFFRSSSRSLLIHHILINLDIGQDEEMVADSERHSSCCDKCLLGCCCCRKEEDEEDKTDVLKKKGLSYLLWKKSYTDTIILHEESAKSDKKDEKTEPDFKTKEPKADNRKDLDDTWTRFFKFQPLWKIRNYFGEKIALYFAWSGTLTSTLWIPMLIGFCIFLYGLALSVQENMAANAGTTPPPNSTLADEVKSSVKDLLAVIKKSFDNDATPYFALIICLWATIFLELWKRKVATLAYEWDVDDFETSEPDRPQFFGTEDIVDPVTKETTSFYPLKRRLLKFTASASVLIFMICMVIISVTAIIIYRTLMDANMCPNISASACLLLTTVLSSILNAVSILLLGKFYDKLAEWLTNWENHRTQTRYDDALIMKLFAFQFVNSYASCFYIAFFRGRFDGMNIFGGASTYRDSCEGTCMSQLSFQILILMLAKPFPKLFKDVVLPLLLKVWGKVRQKCCKVKVDVLPDDEYSFLEEERRKPSLGDFTLHEYNEKVIQYGFLMLFAASFPLAPLLALLTNLIDMRVDAKRMLWLNRRPIAYIAQDIGMWFDILTFVNFCGVLTNAFLIAFTSSWGATYSLVSKLWIVIGFEHIVLTLKYILAYIIPDVPADVRLAIRMEKHEVSKKMSDGKVDKGRMSKKME